MVGGQQLKRHNKIVAIGVISGAIRHPKDVPFVREFWWGTYGLGAIRKPTKQSKFWRLQYLSVNSNRNRLPLGTLL